MDETRACLNLGKSLGKTRGGGGEAGGTPHSGGWTQVPNRCRGRAGGEEGTGNCGSPAWKLPRHRQGNASRCHILHFLSLTVADYRTNKGLLQNRSGMDRGDWRATIHGVAKSRTRLSDFTSPQNKRVRLLLTSPVEACCVCACLTLRDSLGCCPPGSSVHGVLQARTLGWAAMPSSRGSF